jgi:hypothetical protein
MQTSRIAFLAPLLVALPFGACDCGEQLQVLAPIIEIGDPYDATFSVCQEDHIRNCSYDFADVGIGRPKLFSFVLKNPSPVDLEVKSITVEGPGAAHFTLEGAVPNVVEHGQIGSTGKIVTVKYSPETETDETADIVIVSDAENLEEGENVVIHLTGSGKNLGSPQLTVDPAQCDFGDVGVGVRAFCDLSLGNTGNQELAINNVRFTDETPAPDVFGNESPFPIPTYISPGTAVSVRFYAVPNTTGEITGGLVLESTDPEKPTVTVPFIVRGAESPTAIARVKSINGAANSSPTPAIEPLDDVVISGDQSVGQGGATITGYAWEIVSKPPESSVTLSAPNGMDTGFRFSSAQGIVNGLDVAGTFVVRLTVTDSNGAVSQNDARVTLNAVPTEGLHIQLSWSAPVDDIDLHLGKGNNPDWCSTNDCYFSNCTFSGPNWDGQSGFTAGDPKLDIDDLNGFGPENINIDTPVNGSYVIGVHAYSGNPNPTFTPTDVTVKIFVGGALAEEIYGHLQSKNDFWEVARVDVNGTTNVVPIDQMSSNFTCF